MQDHARVLYHATLAEEASRYQDMYGYMQLYVMDRDTLDISERNLLSIAIKNVFGELRCSWRILTSIMQNEGDETKLAVTKEYVNKIESELEKVYQDVIVMLKKLISHSGEDPEACIFYNKFMGDFNRYKSEYAKPNDKELYNCKLCYEAALEQSKILPSTDPMRLSLALSYSVMYYEQLNDKVAAIKLAKEAFDAAIPHIDSLPAENYKDSTLILGLLRDNVTLWISDNKCTLYEL